MIPILSHAQIQTLVPGVNVKGSYNDNITLARKNATKQDDFIIEVNPYIAFRRESKRLKLNVDYQLQSLTYTDQTENNDIFHQFRADVDANIAKDIFFVKAAAQYGQSVVDPTGGVFFNNQTITTNRTDVTTAHLNPYGVFKFGGLATAKLGVDRGVVRYKTNVLNDSDRTLYNIDITSGTAFNKFEWNTYYSKDDVETNRQIDTTYEKVGAGVRYMLNRKISLLLNVGNEKHEYQRAVGTSKPDGVNWNAGVAWTPSMRTRFEIRAGERFFGKTGEVHLFVKGRRVNLAANYKEDVITSTITEFERSVFRVTDPFGRPVFDADGNPELIEIGSPVASSETFIRKRLNSDLSWKSAKSHIGLNIFDERRLYQQTNGREDLMGVRAFFNWDFALRTKLLLNAMGQIRDFRNLDRKDGTARITASIERKMRKKLTGRISLIHNRLESSDSRNDYSQNVFLFGVNWKL